MKTNINNPETLKKGDKVLVISSKNGAKILEGKVVEVVRGYTSKTTSSASVKYNGKSYTLFNTSPVDSFCLAEREQILEYLNNRLKTSKEEYEKEIAEINSQIEYHTKYESEEDYVAHKLEDILSAHSKSKSKTSRVSAMKEILATMKKSDFI